MMMISSAQWLILFPPPFFLLLLLVAQGGKMGWKNRKCRICIKYRRSVLIENSALARVDRPIPNVCPDLDMMYTGLCESCLKHADEILVSRMGRIFWKEAGLWFIQQQSSSPMMSSCWLISNLQEAYDRLMAVPTTQPSNTSSSSGDDRVSVFFPTLLLLLVPPSSLLLVPIMPASAVHLFPPSKVSFPNLFLFMDEY